MQVCRQGEVVHVCVPWWCVQEIGLSQTTRQPELAHVSCLMLLKCLFASVPSLPHPACPAKMGKIFPISTPTKCLSFQCQRHPKWNVCVCVVKFSPMPAMPRGVACPMEWNKLNHKEESSTNHNVICRLLGILLFWKGMYNRMFHCFLLGKRRGEGERRREEGEEERLRQAGAGRQAVSWHCLPPASQPLPSHLSLSCRLHCPPCNPVCKNVCVWHGKNGTVSLQSSSITTAGKNGKRGQRVSCMLADGTRRGEERRGGDGWQAWPLSSFSFSQSHNVILACVCVLKCRATPLPLPSLGERREKREERNAQSCQCPSSAKGSNAVFESAGNCLPKKVHQP